MSLIRNTTLACALGASLVLVGCNNSGHEEGMKALRENKANPILQAEDLQPKSAKDTATE